MAVKNHHFLSRRNGRLEKPCRMETRGIVKMKQLLGGFLMPWVLKRKMNVCIGWSVGRNCSIFAIRCHLASSPHRRMESLRKKRATGLGMPHSDMQLILPYQDRRKGIVVAPAMPDLHYPNPYALRLSFAACFGPAEDWCWLRLLATHATSPWRNGPNAGSRASPTRHGKKRAQKWPRCCVTPASPELKQGQFATGLRRLPSWRNS